MQRNSEEACDYKVGPPGVYETFAEIVLDRSDGDDKVYFRHLSVVGEPQVNGKLVSRLYTPLAKFPTNSLLDASLHDEKISCTPHTCPRSRPPHP